MKNIQMLFKRTISRKKIVWNPPFSFIFLNGWLIEFSREERKFSQLWSAILLREVENKKSCYLIFSTLGATLDLANTKDSVDCGRCWQRVTNDDDWECFLRRRLNNERRAWVGPLQRTRRWQTDHCGFLVNGIPTSSCATCYTFFQKFSFLGHESIDSSVSRILILVKFEKNL